MKRVFVIHGWGGSPNKDWFPWIGTELKKHKFTVYLPEMPTPNYPRIDTWTSKLKEIVGKVDKNTYFIGHSIGSQTILRYLETLPEKEICGGVILVAGWTDLTPESFEKEEDKTIARPWLSIPIKWEKIKLHSKNFISIFSDNDPFVSIENAKVFDSKLKSKTIILKGLGHINEEAKVTKLPIIIEELLKIAKDL